MEGIWQGSLSSACITIPEFTFMVIITLWFMKRNDMLDLYNIKDNLKSILLISVPPAILYDTLNYVVKTSPLINRVVSFTILYILLVHILKKREIFDYPKLKQKALIYLIVSLLGCFVIETVTFPIILKLLNETYQVIKLDFYLVLMCSIPSRVIQILILVFIFVKKNNRFQINILDYLFKNKYFMYLSTSLVLGLLVIESYFIKLIVYNNILENVNSIYEQLFIIIGITFVVPALLIIMVYSSINNIITVINSEKQTIRND